MNAVIKHIVSRTYKPLLSRYLRKERRFVFLGVDLKITPGVFHPGFFQSTKMLATHLTTIDLRRKSFLELGCGSGLIAILAAKEGAEVTAVDINPIAVECARKNALRNGVLLKANTSDLFSNVTNRTFDIIAINPPYYQRHPQSAEDHAWYCGENGEYFQKLFLELKGSIHQESLVLMVLSDGCEMEMINGFVSANGFYLQCLKHERSFVGKHSIYSIKQAL